MRTITIYELAAALLCTERNIRGREGKSLPRAIYASCPRKYDLADVLWIVHWQEREAICKYVKFEVGVLKRIFENLPEGEEFL